MKKSSKTADRLTNWEVATYSLGALGSSMSGGLLNAFLLAYLCIYMRLSAPVITVAFVLARLWDAVNDPMLAALVNNCKRSRWGRYRPWIFWGAIINAVCLTFMFFPVHPSSEAVRHAYYITMYVLCGMSYTVLDVPFWSMLPTIADTTDERNRASSFVKLVGGFGGFIINAIGTSYILPKFAEKGMETAYLILAITASAVMLIFVNFTVLGNKEKYEVPYTKINLKIISRMFKTNDQLRAYAVTATLYGTGSAIATGQILYLFVYYYENGANYLNSKYSFTLFWIIACTGQGIAMMFYSLITKKIPREKIFAASYWLQILSFFLLFTVFFFLKPGAEYHFLNSVAVALSGAFYMLAGGMQQIGSTVMIADVVDYGEWKAGLRGDSVIFSVSTLLGKLAGSIAMLIVGFGITVSKLPKMQDALDPATNKIVQRFVDAAGNVVDPATMVNGKSLLILRAFMFLIPIPLCLAGYFVYKKKYWLFGEKYQKIKNEIDLKRKEKKAETVV